MRTETAPVIGALADGDLGQYLVICPSCRLVAVRMIRSGADYDARTDGFPDSDEHVRPLPP